MSSIEHFTDEIDRLSRLLMRNLECCDRTLVGCCGITAAQAYAVLAMRELGEATMNELALEMRLHGTTMTRMVDALVQRGLAERRTDPADRRIVRVMLSPRGEDVAEQLHQAKRQFLSAAFESLSEAEREAIVTALQRLAAVAEELGAACC